jgi:hypothetical protein
VFRRVVGDDDLRERSALRAVVLRYYRDRGFGDLEDDDCRAAGFWRDSVVLWGRFATDIPTRARLSTINQLRQKSKSDAAASFEPGGRRFESVRVQIYKLVHSGQMRDGFTSIAPRRRSKLN